jgi:plasmid maintenance system antidote protein VapI
MPQRTAKLLLMLKLWADQQRGRRAEIARYLGMPRQVVTDILNGRQNPTSEQALAIQEYLREKSNVDEWIRFQQ